MHFVRTQCPRCIPLSRVREESPQTLPQTITGAPVQDLSASSVDPLGNVVTAKPLLSSCLSVNPRGFLRLYHLYAGPIVGIELPDADGNRHIFAAFTSTSEPRHAKR